MYGIRNRLIDDYFDVNVEVGLGYGRRRPTAADLSADHYSFEPVTRPPVDSAPKNKSFSNRAMVVMAAVNTA